MTTKTTSGRKRHWLRGGMLGVAVVLLAFLANLVGALIFNLVQPPEAIFSSEYPLMFPFGIFSLPAIVLFSPVWELTCRCFPELMRGTASRFVYMVVVDCVLFFAVGCVAGLLFDRLERRATRSSGDGKAKQENPPLTAAPADAKTRR